MTKNDPSGLVLIVIDGTGSEEWSRDPDGKDPATGRRRSHSHNFYEDYPLNPGEQKYYFHGPACLKGSDTRGIYISARDALMNDLANNPDQEINIVGHSRGGHIAMELARYLQSKGYRVNFLGIYDAVDNTPTDLFSNDEETIPSNVDNAAHAIGYPRLRSRWYFDTQDGGPEDRSQMESCHIEMFWATHGGIGGAPWAGDHPKGTARSVDEEVSKLVDEWMRRHARGAGIQMPNTPFPSRK